MKKTPSEYVGYPTWNVWAKIRVSTRGEIILPKDFREELEIKEGDEFYLTESNGYLVLKPAPKRKEVK